MSSHQMKYRVSKPVSQIPLESSNSNQEVSITGPDYLEPNKNDIKINIFNRKDSLHEKTHSDISSMNVSEMDASPGISNQNSNFQTKTNSIKNINNNFNTMNMAGKIIKKIKK